MVRVSNARTLVWSHPSFCRSFYHIKIRLWNWKAVYLSRWELGQSGQQIALNLCYITRPVYHNDYEQEIEGIFLVNLLNFLNTRLRGKRIWTAQQKLETTWFMHNSNSKQEKKKMTHCFQTLERKRKKKENIMICEASYAIMGWYKQMQ